MKRIVSVLLAVTLLFSLGVTVSAENESVISFKAENALYVHAVSGSDDTEAWSVWQCVHNEEYEDINADEKYFFLPTSADTKSVDIYNGFKESVSVNGTQIDAGKTAAVSYKENKEYTVKADEKEYTLRFIKSNAEAAVYVNNDNADKKGTDLFTYLSDDKSYTAAAAGAIVTPDGKIDNTPIKKIKGRGNTTWGKAKKPFNITYKDTVSIAGMDKGKKYSLLANYQDDSLSRNRFLYDLSDAVGMPYASDSRYVDFYINGYYWGSYQMAEKIEVGKNSLISDFSENDYLNKDGSVKEDFPFLCEVDAGATEEDYYVDLDNQLRVTIKAPELSKNDPGYNEVKKYVKSKFEKFSEILLGGDADVEPYADSDSVAKLFIINELGKNWDVGVSSFFFTYRQDENGKYKFYGSPVWDYDNSLGNANGIKEALNYIGVDDYTKPTGWWVRYTFPEELNSNIRKRAKEIWFESFVPAIEHFTGKKTDDLIGKEFYTADEYFNLVEKSAEMNYKSGWLLNTGSWIADHSSLTKADYDKEKNTYFIDKYATSYPQTFKGMYDYCRDWMVSRAAWISKELSDGDTIVETVDNGERIQPTAEAVQPSTEPQKSAVKKANTMKIKAKTVRAKASKKTVINKTKAFKITKAVGKLSFIKKSGNKKIKVSASGKITVKKGLKKGKLYKVKITVTAKGNAKYKAKSKTVTVKVKVK